jgi:thiamine pyrophosphate-dependent acetolactate synthase large subunit-like protein
VSCRARSLNVTLARAGAGEASLQDFLAANPDFLEQAGELEGAGLAGALGSGLPSALAGGMDADPSPIMRFSSDGSMMEQLMRTASSKCATIGFGCRV